MMNTLSVLLEKWEHPFSGKDTPVDPVDPLHEDDDGPRVDDRYDHHKLHLQLVDHYQDLRRVPPSSPTEPSPLMSAHHVAIREYTGIGYKDINNSLYKTDHMLVHLDPEQHKTIMSNLDNAMIQKKTPTSFHVYSGVKFDPRKLSSDRVIKAHLPAFTSTSLRPSVAAGFSEVDRDSQTHLIKIHVPEGSHGVYAAGLGGFVHEREFILPRNSRLHILRHPTFVAQDQQDQFNPHKIYTPSGGLNVYHARLVHDGTNDLSKLHNNDTEYKLVSLRNHQSSE